MRVTTIFVALLVPLGAAGPLSAQQGSALCPTAPVAASDSIARRPDIVISASAQMREVRFQSRPQARIELRGCPALDSVRVERDNLPKPVQPEVTYRDVSVGIQATGYLNVECLPGATGGRAAPADTLSAALERALAGVCATSVADTAARVRRPRR